MTDLASFARRKEIRLPSPLLPRIASGDSTAIDECIERYGGLVWGLARRLSPSTADAEDAVQEIFVDIWRSAARFREDVAGESTFIATLARRRLIDRLRKSKRELDPRPLDGKALDYPAPSQTSTSELVEESSRAAACLERLRTSERQVLELSIYHGLTQSRIAESMGLPLGTVKTHSRRGLSQLRECMQAQERSRAREVEAR